MGVNYQTYVSHENGNKGLSRVAQRYAEFYRVSLDWLLRGAGAISDGGPAPARLDGHRLARASAPRQKLLRDLPILGQAGASIIGSIAIDEPIGYEIRPPALAQVPDAYALYVAGDSMEPRYFSGELVYVNPRRPCRAGDDVVVQVRENGVIVGYVKKLIRRGDQQVICTQYNNYNLNKPIEISYPAGVVQAVHRLLTAHELMHG